SRLARDSCGDDADVGAAEVRIVVRSLHLDVPALHRTRGGEVERLALRQALDDVEQGDVGEPFQGAQVRERTADHPGADECDLLPCHRSMLLLREGPSQTRKTSGAASR